MSTCPHCGQDGATDHAGCVDYLRDLASLNARLGGAGHRLADAATYVLASAPADRRITVALAVVAAWKETDNA